MTLTVSLLLRDALEQLLDGRAVADEGGGHLQAAGRDVAHGRLHENVSHSAVSDSLRHYGL